MTLQLSIKLISTHLEKFIIAVSKSLKAFSLDELNFPETSSLLLYFTYKLLELYEIIIVFKLKKGFVTNHCTVASLLKALFKQQQKLFLSK